MLRIGRWMLNGLTVLSLLICVATVVESVRSIIRSDTVALWDRGGYSYTALVFSRGGLTLMRVDSSEGQSYEPSEDYRLLRLFSHSARFYYSQAKFRFAGFGWGYDKGLQTIVWNLTAPLPLITAVTGVLPAWRLRVFLRRRRVRRLGLCRRCLYDLTGNVSGVCPECGTAIARER